MEEDDQEAVFGSSLTTHPPPPLVTLSPFSPSISQSMRRLSTSFAPPSRPVRAARQLAWVSLQGRLVGAEEASSAKTIGGNLAPQEALAWELFRPIHRILIVAVVAVAAANSKKHKQISQLKKAVQLRDQVLLSMQQKLDNLCEQVNYFKDQPECATGMSDKKLEFPLYEASCDKNLNVGRGCWLCDQHMPPLGESVDISVVKEPVCDEMLKNKMPPANEAEPEERRMSCLSDWAPSLSSSIDVQFNTSVIEQDIFKLRKECEEKDATIKELSIFIHSSKVVGSKRIVELEDIIRRKNMIITKLKKDMLVLEQKVVNLTRLRRPSSSTSSTTTRQLPMMADNVLYDMDSTTSLSSSDSDRSPRTRPQAPIQRSRDAPVQKSDFTSRRDQILGQVKGSTLLVKSTDQRQKSRPVSPLKEKSMNQEPDLVNIFRSKQSLFGSGVSRTRKRAPTTSKDAALLKRWL